jgi:hypothetical protein
MYPVRHLFAEPGFRPEVVSMYPKLTFLYPIPKTLDPGSTNANLRKDHVRETLEPPLSSNSAHRRRRSPEWRSLPPLASSRRSPPGSARLAHLEGNVSIQPYGVDDWGQAYSNMPAGPGDRLFTDQQGRGELQAGQVRAYFSPNSDLTLVNINDGQGVELGAGQGSFDRLQRRLFPRAGALRSDPQRRHHRFQPGRLSCGRLPDQQSTIITNYPNK